MANRSQRNMKEAITAPISMIGISQINVDCRTMEEPIIRPEQTMLNASRTMLKEILLDI